MDVLQARIRKRQDKDIKDAISRLNLEDGEMSDLVREGFRMALRDYFGITTSKPAASTIAQDAAKLVARELMQGIRSKGASDNVQNENY